MDIKSTSTLSESNRFAVVVNNTGSPSERWTVEIWENTSDPNKVDVRTIHPNGNTSKCTQTVTDAGLTVSLTGGTLNDRPCVALGYDQRTGEYRGYGAGISTPYNVSFENGDTVRGNYSFVVANSPDTATLAASPGPGPTPYMTDAVYATDVEFTYVNANINYTADVRVAPGEPDA
jgi:hypothetical protein